MVFYNPFSKKALKKEIFSKIIIDHREKNSLVPSFLISLNCPIEFSYLSVGDYLINSTLIERKTLSDFKSSILDKRIFNQIEKLKEYENRVLIIEETDSSKNNIMDENAFRGAILSISLKHKISIIFTKSQEDTAKYLFILAKKTPKPISLRPFRKAKTNEEIAEYILEGFPNIGPLTSKKLLIKFGSIKNIINAKKIEIEKILGEKKAAEFERIINAKIEINKDFANFSKQYK